jgi:hypothetical protein
MVIGGGVMVRETGTVKGAYEHMGEEMDTHLTPSLSANEIDPL